ncbi:beta-N-acetylhexosaminidase [Microbacterium caowuchunii]|uniref:beta-N-acetylhexosaminidase n=1 Tax=Microbacterium caowuchunii TaxID=2614638 RepID=A0A5N0TNG8_9MICO|nr:beta-N-acetylhexosaminidase [Microbacterium caowuchunii]KAA9135446.1 family 20 glycosylhydrolase [Microbacterium caowuchunii]
MPLGLIPYPRSVQMRRDSLPLDPGSSVSGIGETASAAAQRLVWELADRTGIPLSVAPPAAEGGAGTTITLRLDDTAGRAPESYLLEVGPEGATIEAADAAGLQYATRTLVQLLSPGRPEDPAASGWHLPAVRIEDAPRFRYRGLMLDVARHFFPVEVVLRVIDRACALGLNHLHLHLSDDQGWRLALASRPELAERASAGAAQGHRGGFYTRRDWDRIVAHAAARRMTLVPEIDMPGHTHAMGLAYPEIAAEPVITDEVRAAVTEFGGGIPTPGRPYPGFAVGFSSLRIHEQATYDVLADVLSELAGMTPGPYLHIGGDEALGTPAEDYAVFMARVTGMVAELGKTPIAWHDAGTVATLAPGTVGQYWGFVRPAPGSADAARGFPARGGGLILSPADAAYLDMKVEPGDPLGLDWANGPTSTEASYRWEPTEVIPGITESDILGVEAALWTETIATEADIEAMLFPRLAAVAEIAWSPASGPERSWESFRSRLAVLAEGWAATGLRFTRTPGVPWHSPGTGPAVDRDARRLDA